MSQTTNRSRTPRPAALPTSRDVRALAARVSAFTKTPSAKFTAVYYVR